MLNSRVDGRQVTNVAGAEGAERGHLTFWAFEPFTDETLLSLFLLSIFSLDLFCVLLFQLEVQSEQSPSRSRCASRSRPGSPRNPFLVVFSHPTPDRPPQPKAQEGRAFNFAELKQVGVGKKLWLAASVSLVTRGMPSLRKACEPEKAHSIVRSPPFFFVFRW